MNVVAILCRNPPLPAPLQGRLHAFRKLRPTDPLTTTLLHQEGMLRWLTVQGLVPDLTACADKLRTPMSLGDLCVSIAWDWQFVGCDQASVVAEATVRRTTFR